jgi:O-antigen/teichoic acid export membrane protein
MTATRADQASQLRSAGGVNLLLQTVTLVSKALLLFVLARYLTPAELGVFGLLVVTLNLAMYVVGLDFYAFSTRELLRRERSGVPRILRDQLAFHGLTYLLVFPLLVLVFVWRVLPWDLAFHFFLLLLLDHLAQELERVLITLQRPVHAAVLFFLRGGVWVYFVIALLAREPALRTVRTVTMGWLIGVAVSLLVGGYWLRDLPWAATRGPIDWRWVRRGMTVCLPFLGATLALRGVFSVDRYSLQAFWGAEAVGVYTFYASIRNAIQSLLDMGVLAVLRPRIISAYQGGHAAEYRSLMVSLTAAMVGTALALCLVAAIGVYPLLAFVSNPIYAEHLRAYWIMLGVTLVAALGDVPHLGLYAGERDRDIIVSSLCGLVVAVALNILLVPRFGLGGAALATLIACTVVTGAKAWFLRVRRRS